MRTLATAACLDNKKRMSYMEISTELEDYKDIFKELTKNVESLNTQLKSEDRITNYVNIVVIDESIHLECIGEINIKDFKTILYNLVF
jgi:hypothetical protein